jgi:hypothetical protein
MQEGASDFRRLIALIKQNPFRIIAVSAIILAALFFRSGPSFYKDFVKSYLPLITPLCLSIVSSIIREEKKTNLKTWAIDLSLGVVTFDLWVITSVTTSAGKVAQLTPSRILDHEDALILLVLGFMLIGLCSSIPKDAGEHAKGRYISTILLAAFCFLLPPKIATEQPPKTVQSPPAPSPAPYEAIMPYLDESLPCHVGKDNWGPRNLCAITIVPSSTTTAAARDALSLFRGALLPAPVFPSCKRHSVRLLEDQLVVMPSTASR